MRSLGKLGLVVLVLLLVGTGAFAAWAGIGPDPQSEALAAMKSDDVVIVETEPWLVFRPAGATPNTGFILYPGGRVDPRAYGPPARAIAAEGVLVVVVPMPLNLAVLSSNAATGVIDTYPQIEYWAVGGHSLGGAMAASYADNHLDRLDGLVLWAAYPAGSNDLSQFELAVVSIFGTRDGLATPDKISASRSLLPADTRWVAIEGGNHAQFGWYGAQSGDNPATIDHQEQQGRIVTATLELLRHLTSR